MAYIKKVDTLANVSEWLSEKVKTIAGHPIDTKKIGSFEEVTQKGVLQVYSVLHEAVKYLNAERSARSLSYTCEIRPDKSLDFMKTELIVSLKDASDEMVNSLDVVDVKIEAELRWF